eukprot:m.55782 g.55782  ORF g.55782 m.55782 type:complete len:458 (-) comp11002_c0_seq4:141-1514(-)
MVQKTTARKAAIVTGDFCCVPQLLLLCGGVVHMCVSLIFITAPDTYRRHALITYTRTPNTNMASITSAVVVVGLCCLALASAQLTDEQKKLLEELKELEERGRRSVELQPSIATKFPDIDFRLPMSHSKATFTRPRRSDDACTESLFETLATINKLSDEVDKLAADTEAQQHRQIQKILQASTDAVSSAVTSSVQTVQSVIQPSQALVEKGMDDVSEMEGKVLDLQAKEIEMVQTKVAAKASEVSGKFTKIQAETAAVEAAVEEKLDDLDDYVAEKLDVAGVDHHFVHYGSKECPSGTRKWYDGITYAGHYGHSGSGDIHCLQPGSGDGFDAVHNSLDLLYPMAGDHITGTGIWRNNIFPCAFCTSSVPCIEARGHDDCPKGYTRKYKGWMMGGHYSHNLPTTRICIDPAQKKVDYGRYNGGYLYATRVQSSVSSKVDGRKRRDGGYTVRCAMCCKD